VDRPVRERLGEGIVDQPVLVDERQPGEARARDGDLEVVASAGPVAHGELGGVRKRRAQELLEPGRHARDGSTGASGYAPCMDVDEGTFEREVVERSREAPVVVDFWAEWCGPCHMLAPVLEGAVAEREGKVALAKVDVDASPSLAARFGVRGIPAVKAFRNGHVVSEFVGAQPPARVAAFLDELTEPSEGDRLVEELAASGELPDVVRALEGGDYATALELLLAELDDADPERRDRIRRLMVALFRDLGQEHPLSARYRRRLSAALF
jgi:thioredoxin